MEPATLEGLPNRAADLAILCEIGDVLNSSVELDEILNRILVGVTAGQGLRFNRAFLLLIHDKERRLRGRLAIGPDNPEEAARVWNDLDHEHLSLREMLMTYSHQVPGSGSHVKNIVDRIDVPLDDAAHFMVRALHQGRARVVLRGEDEASSRMSDVLGVDRFALVPILSRRGPVGILLADNAITGRPIDASDLDILRLFANHAGTAIEKARLYGHIRQEKEALERAHRDLKNNQQMIINLQRLSDLGEMAARVAHEIRNPLVAIGGFARSMLAHTGDADPRHKPLQIIVGEVAKLETILQEVLDFARPFKLNAVPTSVNSLVAAALEMIEHEREALGVELAVALDGTCREIPLDADLLKIAMLNLLRNALQSIPRDGGRRGRLSVRTRDLGSIQEVAVQDNGCGIGLDVADRVFEPFFTTKPSGSGLGLAIVSQILREHRGRVRFESRPDEGTTFYLDLPFVKGSAA
ncbi:MAG TPA: ATP-binding protein [Candidatus Polarisedimenticolia bacterium]|nr:ATP-binding protein [Candidatus Polarisedimenticolia bacterium]